MNRITNVKRARKPKRAYESPLRDEQAEATRTRILDGLVRTMGRGIADLSVPAVAAEAGVSVPTVYRYFPTKRALVAALAPRLAKQTGLMEIPESDDIGEVAKELFRRQASMDDASRAAMASQLGNEVRQLMMPKRVAMVRSEMARRAPGLSHKDLERFTRVAIIATSSAMLRAYRDYFGLGPKEAGDDMAWVLRRLAGPGTKKERA